jgi:formamidopyrimidine-DNA glycosylase
MGAESRLVPERASVFPARLDHGLTERATYAGAMPELPEVETVRAGLARLLGRRARIARVELTRGDLRAPIPRDLPTRLAGQPIRAVRRRAKYLLFETPAATLLCHLGMTGTWRLAPQGDERAHDHCYLHLADGRRLAFRDPRRFGLLDLVEPGGEGGHRCLAGLGPEPLDAAAFTIAHLAGCCRARRSAIKPVIMDQAVVVGVGNIYAQEALFRAGIRPTRAAGRVKRSELAALIGHIQEVLTAAIAAGGSTISDFRQAGGDGGYFQHDFRVYGRGGEACQRCGATLASGVVGGRGTTWCRRCQR